LKNDDDNPLYEPDLDPITSDPDEVPIRDRKVFTQPYDLVVESLIDQIENGTIFLRPLSERPTFQRRYVWTDVLASRLIESVLLNVPIPPCYLSQNDEFELDVIDGQQRLFSLYRFIKNQFTLTGLEVLSELNGKRYHEMTHRIQRKINTHTLRLVAVTNESHPEIKFDVFQRLNTNTVPLNAQELRNCVYRGTLNELLKELVLYEPWLDILNKKKPDKRMRDEELVLRFFSFYLNGIDSYRTLQKHWLNDTAKDGMKFGEYIISELRETWEKCVNISLIWFSPNECFRRETAGRARAINRALFDLVMLYASTIDERHAIHIKDSFRNKYSQLLIDEEFVDLISRAVDHTKRAKRRFEIWENFVDI